ncbi:uncharacterized protein LOC127264730 [Andrographis paniculata]|uniref:uncharacterized protein LOC127264730 n=1 Tax=Andrographis paniculata TaxID=175694 RepID=UPI0021E78E14|nr:uncharacterized protein LOC127264730 [Andrographis paniculata]
MWTELRTLMRKRFAPPHYHREVFRRLQSIQQGSRSVEEYYKELETLLLQADICEDQEQMMSRFSNGLQRDIVDALEMYQYVDLEEMVHFAIKVEKKLKSKWMQSNTFKLSSIVGLPKAQLPQHINKGKEYESESETEKVNEANSYDQEVVESIPESNLTLVTLRALSTLPKEVEDIEQRKNLFHGRYEIATKWLNNCREINVTKQVLVGIELQGYEDETYDDVFSDEVPHDLPPTRGIKFQIDFVPGASIPNRPAYRANPNEVKEIRRQVEDLLSKDLAKVAAIQEWPTPTSVRNVCSFHGLASFYRRFMRNFSTIAAPLTAITKKEDKFEWGSEQQNAFDTLKSKLTCAPVLALPGIDVILSQEKRLVVFFSEKLHGATLNYSTYDKELYSLVWVLQTWQHYLRHLDENLKSWEECLAHAEFAYNRTIHSSTNCSQFEVVYGFNPLTSLDLMSLPRNEHVSFDGRKMAAFVQQLHSQVRDNLRKTADNYAKQANRGRKKVVFEIGYWVWLHLRKERFSELRNS